MIYKQTLLSNKSSIQQAILNLNKSGLKIVCVVNKKGKLLGTISDGDIRRGLLKKLSISSLALKIMNKKPKTLRVNSNSFIINELFEKYKLNALPVVDSKRIVKDIKFKNKTIFLNNEFYIIAGGKGSRMMPLTKTLPKPLLSFNGSIIIERIVEKAIANGFNNITISVGYLAEKIVNYLKKYKKTQTKIRYIFEKKALGTAGSLSNFSQKKTKKISPIVVTNADLSTDLNFDEILYFHKLNKADITMAVKRHTITNPYGVVKLTKGKVKYIFEKPSTESFVNAGIYIFNRSVLNIVKKNVYLDIPDLVKALILKNKKIIAFPVHEDWRDLQKPKDLD